MGKLFFTLLLLAPLAVGQTGVYRSPADTPPLYSDDPAAGSALELPHLNSVPASAVRPSKAEAKPQAEEKRQLEILSPSDGMLVAHQSSGVRITASFKGALATGEQIHCLLNGVAVAVLNSSFNCWVPLPERGEQQLQLAVYSVSQQPVLLSEPVSIVVQRHHLPAPPLFPSQQ